MPATAAQPAKWNAADYAANSAAQQIWARELIAQLNLRGDEHILDVGCGDGKVTAELARAVPKGSVIGIDTSPEMIRFARKTFPRGKHPNLEFQIMDAREIIRLGRGSSTLSFPVRCCIGWTIIRHFCAARRRACVRADGWSFRAAARATRRTFLWLCGRRCGSSRGANFSGRCQNRIFFTVRRITKSGCCVLVSRRITSGCRPRMRSIRDATALPRGFAPRGCLTLNAYLKTCARSSPPVSWTVISPNIRPMRRAAFTSAWCGWKLTR